MSTNIDKIKKLLEINNEEVINKILETFHPRDILEVLEDDLSSEIKYWQKLNFHLISKILNEAEDLIKYKVLQYFDLDEQKEILKNMATDEVADLLNILQGSEKENLINILNNDAKEEILSLSLYPKDTAGGLMTSSYISISENYTIKQTIKLLQVKAPSAETAYYIYVVNDLKELKGIVSLRDIIISSFEVKLSEIINKNVISINHNTDQEEVANTFKKYGFLALPVVNDNNKLIGIITADDVYEIIENEANEDIYRLAGLNERDKLGTSVINSIKSRLPWLCINLITAFMASMVVNYFDETISQYVIIASFMPIIAGMGGNAGTQSLTLIIREIATDSLDSKTLYKIFLKEISIGAINGIIIGSIVALTGALWMENVYFGIILMISIILNIIIASISGLGIPLVLKKINIDPALASGVFVTTITDVLGFFIFLSLSTIFIKMII